MGIIKNCLFNEKFICLCFTWLKWEQGQNGYKSCTNNTKINNLFSKKTFSSCSVKLKIYLRLNLDKK